MSSNRFAKAADRASLERAAAALQSHGIDAVIVPDAAAAKAAVLGRVPKGSDVFTMTSVTLDARSEEHTSELQSH